MRGRNRGGRPHAALAERKRRHYAELIAADRAADVFPPDVLGHAATVGLTPERALRLLSDRSFSELVDAVEAGLREAAA